MIIFLILMSKSRCNSKNCQVLQTGVFVALLQRIFSMLDVDLGFPGWVYSRDFSIGKAWPQPAHCGFFYLTGLLDVWRWNDLKLGVDVSQEDSGGRERWWRRSKAMRVALGSCDTLVSLSQLQYLYSASLCIVQAWMKSRFDLVCIISVVWVEFQIQTPPYFQINSLWHLSWNTKILHTSVPN
jgi:hypothetical protein